MAAFFKRYIALLQDLRSLLTRKGRDRLPYTKKFLANLSGLLTAHKFSGFEKLLDVWESEVASLAESPVDKYFYSQLHPAHIYREMEKKL